MTSTLRPDALLIGLGALWCLHYLPEGLFWSNPNAFYWVTLLVDLIFAGILITSGLGLRRESDWAPNLASQSAGTVFVMSFIWLIFLAPHFLSELRGNPVGKIWNFMPRMLAYLLGIVLCPFVVRLLFKEASPQSRKHLWMALAWSGVYGAVIMAVLLGGFR
jgi:hypothetical protein